MKRRRKRGKKGKDVIGKCRRTAAGGRDRDGERQRKREMMGRMRKGQRRKKLCQLVTYPTLFLKTVDVAIDNRSPVREQDKQITS